MKWTIEGYSDQSPFFLTEVEGDESTVRLLLQLLAARHLTEDEITGAVFGTRTDLAIHRDFADGRYHLATQGRGEHYIARRLESS